MWIRRILYALALLMALLGQMLDVGYAFHYIFVFTLLLPLLALAVSLPAMLGCRGRLRTSTARTVRGGKCAWELVVKNRFPLPVGRVKGLVSGRNLLTGAVERRRFSIRGAVSGSRETWQADTDRCGLIQYRLESLWVCDCMGIFALPARRTGDASLIVEPAAVLPGPLHLPEGMGQSRPAPRGKAPSGEDYELRPYRVGDSMRSIHWKQSAKRDELVSRETLEDRRPLVVLTLEHFGAPEEVDRALDALAGYARTLLEAERPFEVRWVHPASGRLRRFPVERREDWTQCLTAVLSDPAPEEGKSILDVPLTADPDTQLCPIHITGKEAAQYDETD